MKKWGRTSSAKDQFGQHWFGQRTGSAKDRFGQGPVRPEDRFGQRTGSANVCCDGRKTSSKRTPSLGQLGIKLQPPA